MASFGGSIKLTGADEYKTALKQISQSLRETGSELTAVASRYDKNDSSLSTLKAKTTEMTSVLSKQNQAYQQLKSAYDTFSAKVSQQAQAHDKLVQTYEKEKQELENIRKASGESSQAFQDQQAKVNDLASAVAKSSQNMNENQIALSKMKTQLNQAEATVNKTTKEIDELGNEAKESGEDAKDSEDKWTSWGQTIADLRTKAIEMAISGLKNLGSAMVDVGKQALNSYANYEQLTGGVETLFKDSAGIVESYANEAYKTAGLSANEYMSTVTSFSASMLQSLDNDTQKSAEYSNRAIIDMSDNANKMGTSMEMIQNAYQGFAKQNYTMLDNLKLGYGGTKGEMERLIADANKVKEANGEMANLSIDSFADVTEAIHIIQTEMGITGTTSKEASTTIEGSVNSMKSAYQNLLTGLASGNADMGKLVQNLVDSVMTSLNNILPAINQIVTSVMDVLPQILDSIITQLPYFLDAGSEILGALVGGIQQNLPAIMQAVTTILNTLITTLVQGLPTILKMGIEIIVSLVQGIAQQMPTLIPQMVEAVITMVDTLIDNIDLIIDAGIQLIIGLAEGLIEALPELIDKIPVIIDKLCDAIIRNLPKIIEMGITLIVKLAEGLIKAIPQLLSKVPQIISSLLNAITVGGFSKMLNVGKELLGKVKDGIVSGIGSLLDVGKNIVQGLWNGINNAKDWILDKIKGIGKSILGAIKGVFGIKSPSTVFRDQVGKNLALGLGEGFEQEMKEVTADMQDALPTNFDTDVNVGSSVGSGSSNYYNMVDAFKEALSEMKIELDDEVAGRFVETTVTNAIYN